MRISDWSSDVCSSDLAALRAGELGGDGLRLPLRLPGHAAHGDRAGAPGARVRPQPDQHRADRDLRSAERSEEHTSELQSLMRTSYAVFCLTKKKIPKILTTTLTT